MLPSRKESADHTLTEKRRVFHQVKRVYFLEEVWENKKEEKNQRRKETHGDTANNLRDKGKGSNTSNFRNASNQNINNS